MNKKLANVYSYEVEYKESFTIPVKFVKYVKDYLKVFRGKRYYKTRMMPNNLPKYYCDVQRFSTFHECVNSKDVVDIHYKWVKENHFMKDSVLYISYTGNLEPFNEEYKVNGRTVKSLFTDYKNHDATIFGYDILKFIAYMKEYSKCDVSSVKKEFIKQCKWLKENEPTFAPDTDDFGKWFDEKTDIKKQSD